MNKYNNKLKLSKFTRIRIFLFISCSVFASSSFAVYDAVGNAGKNVAVRVYNDTQYPVYYYYNSLSTNNLPYGWTSNDYSIAPSTNMWDFHIRGTSFGPGVFSYIIPLNRKSLIIVPLTTNGSGWDVGANYFIGEVSNNFNIPYQNISSYMSYVGSFHMATSYNWADPNWHGCIAFKQEGNDLKIYQSGRGDCGNSYDNYDLVKTFPNTFANNSFWPYANICNKTGKKINVSISDKENIKTLEVPGGWGANSKFDFDLLQESCGKISHLTDSSMRSGYKITIKDADGNTKIEQYYRNRPNYPVFDNETQRVVFADSKNSEGWEILFKPKAILQSLQTSCLSLNNIKCTGVKQNNNLVQEHRDWPALKEFQYSSRMNNDIVSQVESNVVNLYIAQLGFDFKKDFDKAISGLIYNSFKKASLTSKQLSEIDGTAFDTRAYPNLELCKVYAPSYSIKDSTPTASNMTDVKVEPAGEVYSSAETLINNLDYVQTFNTLSFAWTLTNSTTHTVMHAWNVGTKVSFSAEFKAELPLVGGAKTTTGFELSLGYNGSDTSSQTDTNTKVVTFPSQSIIVNPNAIVLYRGVANKAKISGNLNVQFPLNNLKVYGLFARDGNCSDTSYKNLKDLAINPIKLLSDPKAATNPIITLNEEKQLIYATDVLKLELNASYNTHLQVSETMKLNEAKGLRSNQMLGNVKFHDISRSQKQPAPLPNLTPFWIKVKNTFK